MDPDEPNKEVLARKARKSTIIGALVALPFLVGAGWMIVSYFRPGPAVSLGADELPVGAPARPTYQAPPVQEPSAKPRPPDPEVKLDNKRVVLEYDDAPAPTPAPAPRAGSATAVASHPAAVDPEEVARARKAYRGGNTKLFNGDANGAAEAYQEALRIYPGYVAGYRGLGLAYTEQGDKPKALAAFRLYLKTVPQANDAPLIKKRLEKLLRNMGPAPEHP